MINLFFFLKYKSQLKRTRPDIVRQIEESLTRAIVEAGGKITATRSVLLAAFKEESIGIWLDIYILIENLKKNIDASNEFYGYALVITALPVEGAEMLARFLSGGFGGVFMDAKAVKRFIQYASFERPSEWMEKDKKHKYGSEGFFKIKELKVFNLLQTPKSELTDSIIHGLKIEQNNKVLLIGQSFLQIRKGLYDYCKNINADFPPLSICFGSIGLGALVDAWSIKIRSLSSDFPTDEIDFLWELLFCDRIRDEVSDFIVRSVKRFLHLIFNYYFNAAKQKIRKPVLIIENINMAGKKVSELLIETIQELNEEQKDNLIILGSGEDDIPEEKLSPWKELFFEIQRPGADLFSTFVVPKLPPELWEIFYALCLFGRYFSPELFKRLFEEEEKNPLMIERAFEIFLSFGVIDNLKEPWPLDKKLEEHSRKILNEKTERVKAMVRSRLLKWAEKRNINPCFRLLIIIAALNGLKQIDDLLLLKSISSDIVNETIAGIEASQKSGQLDELVGFKRAQAIKYVYVTSRALYTGNEKDIDFVFSNEPADCEAFPILKSQTIVNLSGYYLGRHDKNAAAEKAKEAILMGQSKNAFCLPQAYRLFALVCLSRQQATESIEYLGFALSNAEKTENYHELGITAYYAASAQFLYGDIFSAQRLTKKSIEHSIAAGRADWADRSRFLDGRLKFELGLYDEACEIFESIKQKPHGNMTRKKESLLLAWIYRSKIYFQSPATQKPEGENYDANLFEIEAAFLISDYERAVALSKSLNNPFTTDIFLYTEQPNWSSGFAQIEHLYFSQGEIQDRINCLFQSLALSNLQDHSKDEAVLNIQKIFKEERLCEMDPWDAIYYYAKYRIIEKTGSNLVDMSTAVSIAFKRLQRRASRIEDVQTRRQYLNGSRWNRELSLAAKDFKLI